MTQYVFRKDQRRTAATFKLGLLASLLTMAASAQGPRTLTISNQCSQTVWLQGVGNNTGQPNGLPCGAQNPCPANQGCGLTSNPVSCFWQLPTPASGTFELRAGKTTTISIPAPATGTQQWSGAIFASTGCDRRGQNCQTGSCAGGPQNCFFEGTNEPATRAEFTLNTNGPDTYDLSLVNGFNIPIEMAPAPGQSFTLGGSGNPYQCGNPGSPNPSNPGLVGCSWTFDPVVNGKDYGRFLRMVPPGGKACERDGDCAGTDVCGLAAVTTSEVKPRCGQQIGWWGANEVCAFIGSAGSPDHSPFHCQKTASGQVTYADLYGCSGIPTCYSSSSSTCCGCPSWVINNVTLPLAPGYSCEGNNPSWWTIAQPWAQFLKSACPMAYSFPYDDPTSTFSCQTTPATAANTLNYTITFCPGGNTGLPTSQPKPLGRDAVRFLTHDSSFVDGRPAFSPDGKHVLFMRSPAKDQNKSTFWIVPTAGGKAELFYSGEHHKPEPLQATRPDWSRTRTSFEIAFTGVGKDDSGTWLLDVRTKQVKKIPLPAESDGGANIWSYPSWYHDGQFLAVTNYKLFVHQLVRAGLEGKVQPLTDPSLVWAGMSSVSPGGPQQAVLVFAGEKPARQPPPKRPPIDQCTPDGYCENLNQIWIQKPGEAPYQIDGKQGRAPWWSPDGKLIAFESNREGGGRYRIFVHSFQEGWTVPVTPQDLQVQHAKWSPDGRRLVFAAALDGGGAGIAIVEVF